MKFARRARREPPGKQVSEALPQKTPRVGHFEATSLHQKLWRHCFDLDSKGFSSASLTVFEKCSSQRCGREQILKDAANVLHAAVDLHQHSNSFFFFFLSSAAGKLPLSSIFALDGRRRSWDKMRPGTDGGDNRRSARPRRPDIGTR